jgi:hypothetical protein
VDSLKQITFSTPPAWVGNEYSSMSPFNCDNTRLLLIKIDHFGLYGGSGAFLKDLPIPASAEPRWSRIDPATFRYIAENALMSYDISDATVLTEHVFTEYIKISGRGESDISQDGDHFVFSGTRPDGAEEVFVYEISTGMKGTVYPQMIPFDGLKITSNNHAILSRAEGLWDLDTGKKITDANGHACPAVHNGKPVLLWCSSNSPTVNANSVAMIDIESGIMDILWTIPWDYAFHIAACNQEWCVVSTDCPKKTLPSQCWKVYFDKIIPAELICDTGSIYTGYNSQVKASLSRDGSKLVGCSNFGKTTDPNYCDVFIVELSRQPGPHVETSQDSTLKRIDYSSYVGKTAWVQVPRPDGALDEIEITWADWLKIKGDL